MTSNLHTTPKWVVVYVLFISILAIMFGGIAYANPGLQFANWSALSVPAATSLAGPLGVYISRNIAMGLLGVFAFVNRATSVGLIEAALWMRLFTDGLDGIHNLIAGNIPVAIFSLILFVVDFLALRKLKQ